MKNTRIPFVVLATLGACAPLAAFAQAAAPAASEHTLAGNVALTSDYRFRGLSQTAKKPAIQGGFDYAHASGVYLGTWASSINANQYPGATMEWDVYGGYKFEPVKDLGVDLGLIQVYYPGGGINASTTTFLTTVPNTTAKSDTTEIYLGLTYQWLSVKYNRTLGSSLFGLDYPTAGRACPLGVTAGSASCYNSTQNTKGSGYLDFGANFEIAEKLTLNLHAGHQTVANYGNFSYSDYKIGLTKELNSFNLGAAVYGTNAKKEWWYAQTAAQAAATTTTATGAGANTPSTKIGETGLVLSVSKTF